MPNRYHRDWFAQDRQPTPEEDNDHFEYVLRFPLPADKVIQSVQLTKGRLIVDYRFEFTDPEILEIEEE